MTGAQPTVHSSLYTGVDSVGGFNRTDSTCGHAMVRESDNVYGAAAGLAQSDRVRRETADCAMSLTFKKKPVNRRNLRTGARDASDVEETVGTGDTGAVGHADDHEESVVKRRERAPKKDSAKARTKISFTGDEDVGCYASLSGPMGPLKPCACQEAAEGQEFKLRKTARPAPWAIIEANAASNSSAPHGGVKYDESYLQELRKSSSAPPGPTLDREHVRGDAALDFSIPDASEILTAKKIREQRRAAHEREEEADDGSFIPLSGSKTKSERESRLVTEDQGGEIEEFEDYTGERIVFGTKTAKERRSDRRKEIEASLLAAEQSDGDFDDDGDIKMNDDETTEAGIFGLERPVMLLEGRSKMEDFDMPTGAVLPTMTGVASRLKSMLIGNDEDLTRLRQRDADIELEIAAASAKSDALSRDQDVAGDRYNFFQELRMYLNSLADFFDEKVSGPSRCELALFDILRRIQMPLVIALEDDYTALYSRRLEKRRRERFEAIDQDYRLVTGLVPIRPPTTANEADTSPEPDDVVAECLGIKHRHMFDDSLETFSRIDSIRDTLMGWKLRFPADYQRAFGSLSIPGAFELVIRYQLWDWYPFEKLARLEDMEWHPIVQSCDTGGADEDEDIGELEVLATVVKTICIPRLKARLPLYDTMSPDETKRLLAIVAELRDYVPTDSPAFKGLLAIIENVFEIWITQCADRYGSEMPHVQVAHSSADDILAARSRLVEGLLPLLENITTWRRYLGPSVATRLGVSFLSRVLLPCVATVTVGSLQQDIGTLQKICSLLQPYAADEERDAVRHALRKWTFKLRLLSASNPAALETIDSLDLL